MNVKIVGCACSMVCVCFLNNQKNLNKSNSNRKKKKHFITTLLVEIIIMIQCNVV